MQRGGWGDWGWQAPRTRCAPSPRLRGEGWGEGRFLAYCRVVAAPVGYEIDRLIEPHPIFPLIQRHAQVDDSEMFEVFNMGIGFCYVVEAAAAERTLAILKAHGRAAQVIGTAVSDPQKIVRIPARGLAGQHKRFWRDELTARRAG